MTEPLARALAGTEELCLLLGLRRCHDSARVSRGQTTRYQRRPPLEIWPRMSVNWVIRMS
jgi:hypothetical protein